MKELRLFYPKSGYDLRLLYPELREYPEFGQLTSKEVLLVWYYACKGSPIDDMDIDGKIRDDRERMALAIKFSGYKNEMGKQRVEKLKELEFDKAFKDAINVMSSFQPDIRRSALRIMTKMIEEAEEIVDQGWEMHALDATKLKAFISMKQETAKNIIEMIKICEKSFGLTEVEVEDEEGVADVDITDHLNK